MINRLASATTSETGDNEDRAISVVGEREPPCGLSPQKVDTMAPWQEHSEAPSPLSERRNSTDKPQMRISESIAAAPYLTVAICCLYASCSPSTAPQNIFKFFAA